MISLGVYLSEDVPEGINPVNNTGALSVPVEADGSVSQTQLYRPVSTALSSSKVHTGLLETSPESNTLTPAGWVVPVVRSLTAVLIKPVSIHTLVHKYRVSTLFFCQIILFSWMH